jgi:hypothetical protein
MHHREFAMARRSSHPAQRQLADNAAARLSATNAKAASLLTGLVEHEAGDRLVPTPC